MAQGNHKLGKATRSTGSQTKKSVKNIKKAKKGNAKGPERNSAIRDTSKAINRKNERLIAAKALGAGSHFNLKDIATKGKNESQRQLSARDKKENKPTKLTDRLVARLSKLSNKPKK